MRHFSVLLVLLIAYAAALSAQERRPEPGHAAINGVIRDAASGAPLAGASIAAGGHLTVTTDAEGRYYFQTPESGLLELRVYCPTATPFFRRVPTDSVRLTTGSVYRKDVEVPPGVCTEPPTDSARVRLEGHYRLGFEVSEFVPCAQSLVGFASRAIDQRIWVQPAPRALRRLTSRQRVLLRRDGAPWLFVRLTGELKGPGSFGHLSGATYQLWVERFDWLSEGSPASCPPPSE
jgi:hypothetical protein